MTSRAMDKSYAAGRGIARRLMGALLLLGGSGTVVAASLTVNEGVVVKFGSGAQMVVRDAITAGQGVVLTSQKDDIALNQTNATPQSAAAGDWSGVRIEKSVGATTLTDLAIRYGGGADGAGLTVRGANRTLKYLQLDNNSVGLRLLDGASPAISYSSFTGNGIGLEANGGALPTITGSQFTGNNPYAVVNNTTGTTVQATGNWWSSATGPSDAANPAGQGDAVSGGVNYASYLTSAPLLNPTLRLAAPATYFEDAHVELDLACVNATEYRIAENGGFVGVSFQGLNNGRASITYALSSGDGSKSISAQFRNAAGTVVTATLNNVRIDTQAPALAITNPAAGSYISSSITLEASASDASGISKVEFYLDGSRIGTDTSAPYSYPWNVDSSSDGLHDLKVIAYDAVGRTSQDSRSVTLARTPPPPDLEGPQVTSVAFNGAALAEGATFARNSTLTVSASDRSGVARVELLLDGATVATGSGSGTYTIALNLTAVADGAHVLGIRATDSLGNASNSSYNIVVAHAGPLAPVITSPAAGITTRDTSVTVSGTAQAGSTVQLLLGGAAAGSPITAGSDGHFAGAVALVAGLNAIQATATDQFGTSTPSSTVQVNLDLSVPTAPGNLTASSAAQGKVRLSWSRSNDAGTVGYDIYRATTAFTETGEAIRISQKLNATTFEDLPSAEGTWYYRVVAVNGVGTASAPTNQAQALSDATLPRALSIVYTTNGKTDPATGRMGQGRVTVAITVSEPLQATPYLSIVPAAGTPIPVDLTKTPSGTYTGSFLVDETTPSGTANALFSARDMVGNRGTDVDAGATLPIDTQGPVLTAIALTPTAPIKNDTSHLVEVDFTLSKAASGDPQITWLLSGAGRARETLTGLTRVNDTTWHASLMLPSDAGAGSSENLSFGYQGKDDLDNVSTRITAANRFQIYQGALPPLGVPYGITAKAQPGGKVQLDWTAVSDAVSYQIYRQNPSDSAPQPLTRTGGISHVDQTPEDGKYLYTLASVRSSNGEESLSGQSTPVEVMASATAPGAPQSLALALNGRGIVASWQPPVGGTVATYNLYRAGGTAITDVTGLTPIKRGIKDLITLDATPSPTQGAYAVTALDAAGNESPVSNSAYLNASLLPVTNLRVQQIGNTLPTLTWNAPNGSVAGYLVYVGPEGAQVKLTPGAISSLSYTDSGFTSGERRYTVSSVDANGVEMPHTLTLPQVMMQVASGLPIRRGIMNKLQVQVANISEGAITNGRVVVRLPVDAGATQFIDHKSESFNLAANETRLVPVIVGGYATMPAPANGQLGLEIAPNEGEFVKVAADQSLEVGEGTLVVGMSTAEFTRGGTGKLKLTIENTTDVDVELLTATGNGSGDSTELRFKVLDTDGNVLASQPYKQVFGANVVTLTNGMTVARIPAGTSYESDVFNLNIPASSPGSVRVKLEVDKLRYHTGQEDQVIITGRGSEKTVALVDTSYVGEVTDVSPLSSFGDEPVVITGRALERGGSTPLPNIPLKLILNQQGFERTFSVMTDATGNFAYTFKPTLSDSGLYKVSAVHPDITDRPEQKAFVINRVTVTPTPFKIDIPKNYPLSIPLIAKAGTGTSASNLRFVLNATSQPTGELPAGVKVEFPAPVSLTEKQSLNVPVVFSANNDAQPTGTLVIDAISDEHPLTAIAQVKVNYTLSDAKPYLVSSPSFMETGLAQGESTLESLVLENKGFQEALNLKVALTDASGSPAPAWVSIVSQADGTLAMGEKRSIDLSFMPSTGVSDGIYEFLLNLTADNIAPQVIHVYAAVTQSGQGNVLFKASDIYTATLDRNGNVIEGLANATITIENEDVPTINQELVTDSVGEALFQNMPAGAYQFRARAANHQELGGRFRIKPGVTLNQSVFLDYNLVTVEWSVREITIEDRYEIILNATFETDVPAPVVVFEPMMTNLPVMKPGDVYYGELSLTNYGLVRADEVKKRFPTSDEYFRYEFLADVPETLNAKQRITIPYRIVSLKSIDPDLQGTASGGGCGGYGQDAGVTFVSVCANGNSTGGGADTAWSSSSGGGGCGGCCGGGGGGGGGGWSGPGGEWGPWGSYSGGGSLGGSFCASCDSGACAGGGCNGGGGSGQ